MLKLMNLLSHSFYYNYINTYHIVYTTIMLYIHSFYLFFSLYLINSFKCGNL
jgi:hypothetical protein